MHIEHTSHQASPGRQCKSNRDSHSRENATNVTDDARASRDSSNSAASHSTSVGDTVLLATARVVIANSSGKSLPRRAIIDPGAERA